LSIDSWQTLNTSASPVVLLTGLLRYADKTTDMTTSHLTKLHKPQQVIGYSHSTKASKLASRWLSQ
jgi:hypothetical protein